MCDIFKGLLLFAFLCFGYQPLAAAASADSVATQRVQQQSIPTKEQKAKLKQLPEDKFHLSATLDLELERLLQSWYEGYSRLSTNWVEQKSTLVPNVHDSVYIQMLDKLPTAIRMSYNPLVREAIELYVYKRKPLLSSMLSLANLYFPEIETALDRNGLPLELKYLTIVESALNPSAVSPMGAAGLWQLMLPTGKIYGLKINSLVDERLDPVKSTEAACRMLKELYNMYGDWFLVMAAYNGGPGTVSRAIKRAGGGRQTFWDIYPYLPRETRRYVPLFVGAYFSMFYHKDLGITPRELGRPLATDYYVVTEALTFDLLSKLSGVSREYIAAYNPQFRRGIIPGNTEPYPVRLPVAAVMKLEGVTDSIKSDELAVVLDEPEGLPVEEPKNRKGKTAKSASRTYKVRKGDTLFSIARKHGVTVKQIKQWNGSKVNKLKPGQTLRVS